MVRSHRLFNCSRCHRQVRICTRCDRGNVYCSKTCSNVIRLQNLREASARYQKSFIGRRNHAARQRRYRYRLLKKVTHQGPHKVLTGIRLLVVTAFCFVTNPTVEKEECYERSTSVWRKAEAWMESETKKSTSKQCHFCLRPCGEFARLGPLRSLGKRTKQSRCARPPAAR